MWQYNYRYGGELYHYGVKGMKWGVRRYQNKDGSLTPEGKERYAALAKAKKNGIIKDETIRKAVESGEVSLKINREKQLRHIKDSKQYVAGKSYLYGDLQTAQKLVDDLAGNGKNLYAGEKWLKKERVISDKSIGNYVDIDGKETPTNKAMIIYSRTGTHIYPRKDDEE